MQINYNNRNFRVVQNVSNGETSEDTIFKYQQEGNIVTASYQGGKIAKGQLIGVVDQNGCIDMRYQQINDKGKIMTGKCFSKPEILLDGTLRLHEKWQWTSGDYSKGNSLIEEI